MDADQAADVAVAGEHDRMAVAPARAASPSATPRQKSSSRRNVAEPRHGTNTATGLLAAAEIEPLERRLDRARRPRRDRSSRRRAASAGAITGTLRSGSVSSGETKIVLPDTCMVYCEAPITVARMRASGALQLRAERVDAVADFGRELRAEIAECLRLAAIDVFGHAAGKLNLAIVAAIAQRIERAAGSAPPARGEPPRIASNSRSAISAGERARLIQREHARRAASSRPSSAPKRRPASSSRTILPSRLEHDQPRADIERGDVDHLAVGADRDLRGAAADVDIHHRRIRRGSSAPPRPSHRPPSRFPGCRRR